MGYNILLSYIYSYKYGLFIIQVHFSYDLVTLLLVNRLTDLFVPNSEVNEKTKQKRVNMTIIINFFLS